MDQNKNLLITTTYKNNFTLLELFYKFYERVWNPSNFLFIVGNTDEDKSKNINIINQSLHINLQFLHNINLGEFPTVKDGILYHDKNIYVYIYDTQLNYPTNFAWDRTRDFLLEGLHKGLENIGHPIFKHNYYINVDNDDLLYTNNAEYTLQNNLNKFHTLEYIPKDTFTIDNQMKFISCHYYYQHKSRNDTIIDKQHTLCRFIDYYDNELHCCHKCEEIFGKEHYKNCEEFDINHIKQCCFAFGCPSLEALINEKHWQQTMISDGKMSMSSDVTQDKIKEDFYKYYCYDCLTDDEKQNIPILTTDFFVNIMNT